jgi:hypothetical protein
MVSDLAEICKGHTGTLFLGPFFLHKAPTFTRNWAVRHTNIEEGRDQERVPLHSRISEHLLVSGLKPNTLVGSGTAQDCLL